MLEVVIGFLIGTWFGKDLIENAQRNVRTCFGMRKED